MDKLRRSFHIFGTGVKVRRLFVEDPGVTGAAWFAKHREDKWHVAANVIRLVVMLVIAPFRLYNVVVKLADADSEDSQKPPTKKPSTTPAWDVELANVPDSVLYDPNGGSGRYEVTGRRPSWLLKVAFTSGQQPTFTQVEWSETIRDAGYITISYSMDSAYELFLEAGHKLQDGMSPIAPKWSLRDRKAISTQVLFEYGKARERVHNGDGEEYIWLDEFCLSSEAENDEEQTEIQRSYEVGQLADIFKGAVRAAVFCHVIGCDHTPIDCPWGTRVFTLGEILHATDVIRLTRVLGTDGTPVTHLHHEPGRSFRGAMQVHAAEHERWHLYAIMQHTSNSGSVSWQTAIQAMVVEVIRRDEASGFASHKLLGKALNGLLPRRARLADLKGKDGWADLAWLLELNQGFYNAASLAAVCNTASPDVARHRWLGQPILPKVGNERLEPLVHAFPVRTTDIDGAGDSALCVVSPNSIPLNNTLRRDAHVWKDNSDMLPLQIVTTAVLSAPMSGSLVLFLHNKVVPAVAIAWITCSMYSLIDLLVGTIYIKRDGWVYLEDSVWGSDPHLRLQEYDPGYKEPFIAWGDRQFAPTWGDIHPFQPPSTGSNTTSSNLSTSLPPRALRPGSLVDLSTRVVARVSITDKPNSLIAMAIHGSGVTCLLLDRDKKNPSKVANKVGIANLPTYVLSQGHRTGSVSVGGGSSDDNAPGKLGAKSKPPKSEKKVAVTLR